MKMKPKKKPKARNIIALQMILRTGNHAGKHKNRNYDVSRGSSRKQKHKESYDTAKN